MSIQHIVTLFKFNYWANEQILDLLEQLTPEELIEPAQISHSSAFELIRHILDVEWSWRLFASGGAGQNFLWEVEEVSDLQAICSFWQFERERMKDYLNSMSEEMLEEVIDYGSAQGGEPQFLKVWQILFHILNHSVHHRSEIGW